MTRSLPAIFALAACFALGIAANCAAQNELVVDASLANQTAPEGVSYALPPFTFSSGTGEFEDIYDGDSTTGSIIQSGGSLSADLGITLGYGSGSSGSYTLSGTGVFSATGENVGYSGNGTFAQSGGTNTISGDYNGSLSLGNYPSYLQPNPHVSGNYTLSGTGVLSAPTEFVGSSGNGIFTQTGGTNTVSGDLTLGYYSGSTGSYTLGAGSLSANNLYVGYGGISNFAQTGGTNAVGQQLWVGFDTAAGNCTYTLSGGMLTTVQEVVGYQGSGTFTQSGGTNNVSGTLGVGGFTGGSGQFTLSGTGTLSAGYEAVGGPTAALFLQTGGTNTVTAGGLLVLGYDGGTGTYTLSGGTLQVPSVVSSYGNPSTGVFNFNGGTLQAGGDCATFVQELTAANVQAGGAVVDTNGHSITVAQVLRHDPALGATVDGGLTKSDVGTLTLTGANTYTGGTQINFGTLLANNATGSATGMGAVTVGSFGILGGSGTISGPVTVTNLGTLNGPLIINGSLTVNPGGLVTLSSGTLTVNGPVVNYGTIRLARGASLVVGNGGTFTNTYFGTLDIMTGSVSAPAGFINNSGGTVLNASTVRAKSVSRSGSTLTVTVAGYTGHTYRLQRSASLVNASYTTVGNLQNGTTSQTLTFTDASASGTQGFYRVQVDP